MAIERVEWPAGNFPRDYVQFSTWGTTLTIETAGAPAGAETVNVYWGRRHALERLSTTIPVEAEETVLLGAAAFALFELAQYGANRANTGGPAVVAQYRDQGRERFLDFRAALRRFGRLARLRTSQLYAPAHALPQSQTHDSGPTA